MRDGISIRRVANLNIFTSIHVYIHVPFHYFPEKLQRRREKGSRFLASRWLTTRISVPSGTTVLYKSTLKIDTLPRSSKLTQMTRLSISPSSSGRWEKTPTFNSTGKRTLYMIMRVCSASLSPR